MISDPICTGPDRPPLAARVRRHERSAFCGPRARPARIRTRPMPIDGDATTDIPMKDMSSPSRGAPRPRCCREGPSQMRRAQGMPGAGRNPWPACRKISRRQSPQVQPVIRHSLRDGLYVLYVISLVRRAFWPPSPREAKPRRELTSASGCQDHTISTSAKDLAPALRQQAAAALYETGRRRSS